MTPELSKTLNELAQRLGTSAEHLWPLLVAQQRLEAWILVVACGLSALLCGVVAWRLSKRHDLEVPTIAVIMLGLLSVGVGLSGISTIVYPEPSALGYLLHQR